MPEFDITTPSPFMTMVRDAIKGLSGALIAFGQITESDAAFWSGVAGFVIASGYAVYKQVKMRESTEITF
jgi:hypothetical protein